LPGTDVKASKNQNKRPTARMAPRVLRYNPYFESPKTFMKMLGEIFISNYFQSLEMKENIFEKHDKT
jgi:hypothetical protein